MFFFLFSLVNIPMKVSWGTGKYGHFIFLSDTDVLLNVSHCDKKGMLLLIIVSSDPADSFIRNNWLLNLC